MICRLDILSVVFATHTDDARRRHRHALEIVSAKKDLTRPYRSISRLQCKKLENRSRKLLETKVDRISFLKDRCFASFVTNRPFAASKSRGTKPPYWRERKQWDKASYIYVNYYNCCIILFVCMQVCPACDIVTFF